MPTAELFREELVREMLAVAVAEVRHVVSEGGARLLRHVS
jgi:hypothetical protein